MRAVVQRVQQASVHVAGEVVGEIQHGLCVLAGAMQGDTAADVSFMVRRISTLRIFADNDGKMNLSVKDVGGSVLLISQFTLAADTTSGARPSFIAALPPEPAAQLIEDLKTGLQSAGIEVATGEFGAKMEVALVNDGPVTIIVDSQAKQRK